MIRSRRDTLTAAAAFLCLCSLAAIPAAGSEIRYFPNIIYGHILIGSGASRYETGFSAASRKETRVTVKLFNDRGEPMEASFLDEKGDLAVTGSSFEFFLAPDHPIRIKIQLAPDDAGRDVAVKTGWATFVASEEIDVLALVRVTSPDGSLLNRSLVSGEIPAAS